MKESERYSTNTSMPNEAARYVYSQQAVDDIVSLIKGNPTGIIDDLKRKNETPDD